MSSTTASETPPKTWAIIELFGHARLAGAVSDHSFGGETFTRVDVPEVVIPDTERVDGKLVPVRRTIQAHTKLIGGKAIYSVAFVDEASALLAAHEIRHMPLTDWQLRRQLDQLPLNDRRALLAIEAPGALPAAAALGGPDAEHF
jgi:hypothetical protein